MHDRLRGVSFQRLFERLNRQVEPPAALVAPAERKADMNVLRLDLGGLAEEGHGVEKIVHGPQRLAAKEQDMGLEAPGVINAIERLEHAAGELVAGIRP